MSKSNFLWSIQENPHSYECTHMLLVGSRNSINMYETKLIDLEINEIIIGTSLFTWHCQSTTERIMSGG